jgi:hypothetical protein
MAAGLKRLNLIRKFFQRGRASGLAAAAAGALLALAGCISSTAPILTGASPVLGERGQIHVYTLADGVARDPGIIAYQWNGSRYLVRGKSIGISDFTLHPYEGRDFVIETTSQRDPHRIEYGLARRLADATYLLVPLNEDDADSATRDMFCTKTVDAACRVATTEQIFAFARATADKPIEGGGLAVVLATPPAAGPARR